MEENENSISYSLEIPLRDVISNVNSTLPSYEKNYVSVSRLPKDLGEQELEIERCTTMSQYIEARFNYECYLYVPEFREMLSITNGHLFKCSELEGENRVKHNFKQATIVLISMDDIDSSSVDDTFEYKLNQVKDTLGGNCIEFNNVVKKVKFNIKNI